MYENTFSDRKKNDKDIGNLYFLCFILVKVCISRLGKRQTGRMIYFFSSFIKIRERQRDIKGHINNRVITSYYSQQLRFFGNEILVKIQNIYNMKFWKTMMHLAGYSKLSQLMRKIHLVISPKMESKKIRIGTWIL